MNDLSLQILSRLSVASTFLMVSGIAAVVVLKASQCRSPAIHRIMWCLVLVQGVLVFEMPVSIPWQSETARNAHAVSPTQVDEPAAREGLHTSETYIASTEVANGELGMKQQSWQWATFVLVCWAGGVLFHLIRWAIGYVRFILTVSCEECDIEEWSREWTRILEAKDIRMPLLLHVSHDVGPMLCRWPAGYRVVVPYKLWRNLTSLQRQSILRHELAHFERGDIPKTFIFNVLALIHWFNPMAWFAIRRFEDSIEWTCDDVVQSTAPGAVTAYASALLAIVEHGPRSTAWTSAIFGGGLSGRIRRLLCSDNRPDGRVKTYFALCLLIGLLVLHVVRVDLVAQEPDKSIVSETRQLSEGQVAQQFFVVPVTTELQRWRLEQWRPQVDNFSAYLNINGMSFIEKATLAIETNRFDFDALRNALKRVRQQTGPGTLAVLIDFGTLQISPDVDAFVQGALARMATDAGFENVAFNNRYSNEDTYEWKGLSRIDGVDQGEPRLGNKSVLVFPVRTPLGRVLAGNADCYVEIPGPIPLDARHILSDSDKVTLRQAVKEFAMPYGATAHLQVFVEKPKAYDNIHSLPQIKKDSEFHRDAVDFLKSLGFQEVVIEVDVGGNFVSRYE